MNGRDYATPDDVKAVAIPVLAHRIVLASGQTDYGAPQDIVAETPFKHSHSDVNKKGGA